MHPAILITILSILYSSCSLPRTSNTTGKDAYQVIFDGKTLDGWEYDPVYWRVENGALVGEVTPSTCKVAADGRLLLLWFLNA